MKAKILSAGIIPAIPSQALGELGLRHEIPHQPSLWPHADFSYLLLRIYKYWDFPKGRVERGELPIEAAIRELKEETGLTQIKFRWGESYIETEPYANGKVARYYLAEICEDPAHVYLPVNPALQRAEHHDFRWMSYSAAESLLVPRVAQVLRWADSLILRAEKTERAEQDDSHHSKPLDRTA